MGSLAVDVGIAKLGTPGEFFQSSTRTRSRTTSSRTCRRVRETIDRVMNRDHARLWAELPVALREIVYQRVENSCRRSFTG